MSKHHSISLLPKNTKLFTIAFVKLIVFLLACFFIYYKLCYNDTLDFDVFLSLLQNNTRFTTTNILFLLLFSVINWLLESIKWKMLVTTSTTLSLKNAAEQSLASLTASIITPNRIGEYGAKAIYFSKKMRKKILALNLIGNLFQLLVTTFFGVIGLFFATKKFHLPISNYSYIALVSTIGFVLCFYWFKKSIWALSFKGYSLKKLKKFTSKIQQQTLSKVLIISVLRYLCFSHQFYFLLLLFQIDISYLDALILISSMYLLASILPSIFIFDVLIKGSVAVWLFSYVQANELVILTITSLMWLLNFAIPSLVGSYFVLHFKLPHSK